MTAFTEATQNSRNGRTETSPLSLSLVQSGVDVIARQSWLDKLADPLQEWVHAVSRTPAMQKFKDILHGTWLGHPLHPVVTDIPVGSWTSTVLLDCTWLVSESAELARAADLTLLLGLGGSVAAAATGLADWSETIATDRRVGLAHGLLNGGALLANLASLGLRLSGKRRAGIAASGLGYALTISASYLGGELSFARGIGVSRVAWEEGADDFVVAMKAADLPEKRLTRVEAQGIPVVLWKEGEKISALAATCSHAGGPLDEGTCQEGVITCPWHGSAFCLSDGSVAHGPAVYAQPTFAVRIHQGNIELRRLARV